MQKIICKVCNTYNEPTVAVCLNCGESLDVQYRECDNCGEVCPISASACHKCGSSFADMESRGEADRSFMENVNREYGTSFSTVTDLYIFPHKENEKVFVRYAEEGEYVCCKFTHQNSAINCTVTVYAFLPADIKSSAEEVASFKQRDNALMLSVGIKGFNELTDFGFKKLGNDEAIAARLTLCDAFLTVLRSLSRFDIEFPLPDNKNIFVRNHIAGQGVKEIIVVNTEPLKKAGKFSLSFERFALLLRRILKSGDKADYFNSKYRNQILNRFLLISNNHLSSFSQLSAFLSGGENKVFGEKNDRKHFIKDFLCRKDLACGSIRNGYKKNYDDIIIKQRQRGSDGQDYVLMGVFDGVGETEGTEVLTRYIAEFIRLTFAAEFDAHRLMSKNDAETVKEFLKKYIQKINSAIAKAKKDYVWIGDKDAQRIKLNPDSASTLVLVLLIKTSKGYKLFHAHLGDSRMYVFNRSSLKYVTTDHTNLGTRLLNGEITEEEFIKQRHSKDAALQLFIDGSEELKDYIEVCAGYGDEEFFNLSDTLLISTDGIFDLAPVKELGKILAISVSAESAYFNLLLNALYEGVADNCTAILLKPNGKESK